ncbi:MAG: hypothetical protein ACRETN_01620 [Nevskiales bacterium]
MKPASVIGILLIVAGAAALAFGQFKYDDEKTILKIGDLEARTQETKTVPLTYAGIGLLVAGVALVSVGAMRK